MTYRVKVQVLSSEPQLLAVELASNVGMGYDGFFFFSSRRRHTRSDRDWSSDVCSSDLGSIASAAKVLEIATRVTDARSRPAARQAAAISSSTAASLGQWPTWGVFDCKGDRKSVV